MRPIKTKMGRLPKWRDSADPLDGFLFLAMNNELASVFSLLKQLEARICSAVLELRNG